MAEPLQAADDPGDIVVTIEGDDTTPRIDPETGTVTQETPDGGVIVYLSDRFPGKFGDEDDDDEDLDAFYRNLADHLGDSRLNGIAEDLIEQISADDASRQGYLADRARGLRLLGTKLEEPRSTVGDSSAPLEGMSNVHAPLMLEAILRSWANAEAELLPAHGPVKVAELGTDENVSEDNLAEALEDDMNWYFTKGIPEYRADTSQMLLWGTHFGGSGFKKVYRCPMRQKPISESVEPHDLIVSDTTKDLRACARITHVISMRPSLLKRMVLNGAYRDNSLYTQPTPSPNIVQTTIAGIQGTMAQPPDRPEDQPYTLWESQCELDLSEYAPGKFKNKGIPLPYLVTIDKDSRQILAIRRDWRPNDTECMRRQMYVKYPYIPGPGFYGTGMVNILGNSTAAMTAAWREALDAGMFASFPGFAIAKHMTRQASSDMRVGPGQSVVIDTQGRPIAEAIMPLPYKDVTPGLMAMIDKVTGSAKGVSGSVDVPAGEGVKDIPVGTMLAFIESSTKIMSAAHKGMHSAQSEEIGIVVGLLREHPEDFWRGNDETKTQWNEQLLLQALGDYKLQPVSDPNVPSHVHRIMKAWALTQLDQNPRFQPNLNPKEILLRTLRALKEDPNGLVIDPPPADPGPPDLKGQAALMDSQTKAKKQASDAQNQAVEQQTKVAALGQEQQIANTKLQTEAIIHAHDADQADKQHTLDQAAHNLAVSDSAHAQTMDIVNASKPAATPDASSSTP